jgi:hypothetical protein
MGYGRNLAEFLEEINDIRWVLENLNRSVPVDTIEAGIVEANLFLVVVQKGIHGGPPAWWLGITMKNQEVRLFQQ